MRKNEFFYQYRLIVLLNNWVSLEKMSMLLFSIALLISCGKQKIYPDYQTYNSRTDTATLVIKVFNSNKLEVNMTTNKMRLLLFDQNNIFYQQINLNGIITPDSTIVLHALPLGHYTALLIVDAPGIDNLNYLEAGKQSYVEVADSLPKLVSATFVATSKNMVLNNPLNNAQLNFQELASLASETYFNFSAVQNTSIWKNPSSNYSLYFLLFQNNTLVLKRYISTTADIKNGIYETPIPQGEDYDFLFVDLTPTHLPILINGKTTIADIKASLETDINNMRMAYAKAPIIENPTENIALLNGITNVAVNLSNSNIADAWTTGCDGFNLLVFNDKNLLTRTIPFIDINNPSAPLSINVFTGNTYTLMALGNAQAVVNTFGNTTTPQFVEIKLPILNIADYWIAKIQGNISSTATYTFAPQRKPNGTNMTTATIAQLKTITNFVANPRKITAIVTSTGTADNDLPNLMILQDATGAGATPIQFTNPPTLKVGDKITIAIQDGSFTTVNNIKYLKDVSYIEFDKTSNTAISPTDISLAQINTPATYNQYEYMLVRMTTPVEFRLFKDMGYGDAMSPTADSFRLRDASAGVLSTLPDARQTINLMLQDNILATTDFVESIPVGAVNTITGFLATNPVGKKVLLPRAMTDINYINGTLNRDGQLATRLDKGIVAQWTNALSNTVGLSHNNTIIVVNGTGAGGATLAAGIKLTMKNNCINEGISFDVNTANLLSNENVKISIAGNRAGTTKVTFYPLVFKVTYKIGTSAIDTLRGDDGRAIELTMNTQVGTNIFIGYLQGSSTDFSLPLNTVKGVGGKNKVTFSLICTSGSIAASGKDDIITFTDISIKQF